MASQLTSDLNLASDYVGYSLVLSMKDSLARKTDTLWMGKKPTEQGALRRLPGSGGATLVQNAEARQLCLLNFLRRLTFFSFACLLLFLRSSLPGVSSSSGMYIKRPRCCALSCLP